VTSELARTPLSLGPGALRPAAGLFAVSMGLPMSPKGPKLTCVATRSMSASGPKQTYGSPRSMSAFGPKQTFAATRPMSASDPKRTFLLGLRHPELFQRGLFNRTASRFRSALKLRRRTRNCDCKPACLLGPSWDLQLRRASSRDIIAWKCWRSLRESNPSFKIENLAS
jgi:hypothetical protein